MDRRDATICALATAPGQGSVAVVRVSGAECFDIVGRVFVPMHREKTVSAARGYTALLGHYRLRGAEMDECIALFFRAPHSYTGEDVIELSVHGGSAMADGLLEALIDAGAAPAAPGEFTRRALEHGRISLTQAEAVMETVAANSRQGAALAKAALDGRLARRIEEIAAPLLALNAHLAAWIDYPEEDVPALSGAALQETLAAQLAALDALVDGYGAGAVLRRGVDCVLLGRPNAGKSTLLNLLAGFDRAIVSGTPGTTRDVVEQAVQLGELRLNVFDTAGVRTDADAADDVEREGIRRALQKVEQAGLLLVLADASDPAQTADLAALAELCRGRPAVLLLNKSDRAQNIDARLAAARQAHGGCFAKILPFCAKDPAYLPVLRDAAADVLGTARLDPGAAQLCTARQFAAAVRARDALRDALQAVRDGFGPDAAAVCLTDALQALDDLTGKDAGEETVDKVFSTFCVGK